LDIDEPPPKPLARYCGGRSSGWTETSENLSKAALIVACKNTTSIEFIQFKARAVPQAGRSFGIARLELIASIVRKAATATKRPHGQVFGAVIYCRVQGEELPEYYLDMRGPNGAILSLQSPQRPDDGLTGYDRKAIALACAGIMYGRFPAAAAALLGRIIGSPELDDIL
jgi:hypothetical protein